MQTNPMTASGSCRRKASLDIATKDLAGNSQSGDQFFGIHTSNMAE